MGIPALTICQPWAWAITHGFKRIENRRRPFSYLGPLLIHAGKSKDWLDTADRFDVPGLPHSSQFEFGAIVGICDLAGCVRVSDVRGQPYAEGPWCLILKNVRRVEPVPYRGAQGLFYVDDQTRAGLQITERPRTLEGIREWTRPWIECPGCGRLPVMTASGLSCCATIRRIPCGDFTDAQMRAAWDELVSDSKADQESRKLSTERA